MAEGGTQTVSCRYFLNGVCRESSDCHFSHDRQNSRPSQICRYYLQGACTYGSHCRYDHVRPERLEASRKNGGLVRKPVILPSKNSSLNNTSTTLRKDSPPSKLHENPIKSLQNMSNTASNSLACESFKSSLCVDAPEFVPRSSTEEISGNETKGVVSEVSFAQVVGDEATQEDNPPPPDPDSELCPYYLMSGKCQLNQCPYVHGLMCEMCQLACLHPDNEEQRNDHLEECTKLMEDEMEHSFAVARSREKVCGICMDIVMERAVYAHRRFGIMPNCNHCFCLDCLRKWRQSKQFENKIIRACPECRVQSNYVIPSRYWVDDTEKEDKEKLVKTYREALGKKACKYFKQGKGQCPFGNKCFYLHALPDGTEKDVGPPKRNRRFNGEGEIEFDFDNMMLWDFIEEREHRLELLRGSIQTLLLELQLEDLAADFYFPEDSISDASDLDM